METGIQMQVSNDQRTTNSLFSNNQDTRSHSYSACFYQNDTTGQTTTSMICSTNQMVKPANAPGVSTVSTSNPPPSDWSSTKTECYLNSVDYTPQASYFTDAPTSTINQTANQSPTIEYYTTEDPSRGLYSSNLQNSDYYYPLYHHHRGNWQPIVAENDNSCHNHYEIHQASHHLQENALDKSTYVQQNDYTEQYRDGHRLAHNGIRYSSDCPSGNNSYDFDSGTRLTTVERGYYNEVSEVVTYHEPQAQVWFQSSTSNQCNQTSIPNISSQDERNQSNTTRCENHSYSTLIAPQQHQEEPQSQLNNEEPQQISDYKTMPSKSSIKSFSEGAIIQRSNQCSVCGRNYARPSTLKTHLRTHTNERPFKCNVCAKTFSQAANLTAHQRVHTGERPFFCPICGRQFSQSSSVITHLRTHSGERPYRCSLCSRTFSDSSTLTKHCRIHSGEKPYQCDYCPLNFSQSGNLSRHLKLHLISNGSNSSTSCGSSSSIYSGKSQIVSINTDSKRNTTTSLVKRSIDSHND